MSNSILEASRGDTLEYLAATHGTHRGSPATGTDGQARIRFLLESATYLGLDVDRDKLVRRFI